MKRMREEGPVPQILLAVSGSGADKEWFQELFSFLQQYHWIHDLQVTKFLEREVWKHMPSQWVTALSEMTTEEVNLLPFLLTAQTATGQDPPSLPHCLATFLHQAARLSHHCQQTSASNLPPPVEVTGDLRKGMSAKKLHEVERMASLVHQVVLQSGCNLVVDVGSGLGYLGQVLHKVYGLPVIGLESCEGHSDGADKRAARHGLHCTGVRNIPFSITQDERCMQQLCSLICDIVATIQPCSHSTVSVSCDVTTASQPCPHSSFNPNVHSANQKHCVSVGRNRGRCHCNGAVMSHRISHSSPVCSPSTGLCTVSTEEKSTGVSGILSHPHHLLSLQPHTSWLEKLHASSCLCGESSNPDSCECLRSWQAHQQLNGTTGKHGSLSPSAPDCDQVAWACRGDDSVSCGGTQFSSPLSCCQCQVLTGAGQRKADPSASGARVKIPKPVEAPLMPSEMSLDTGCEEGTASHKLCEEGTASHKLCEEGTASGKLYEITATHTHCEELTASHAHCGELIVSHTHCEEVTASNTHCEEVTSFHTHGEEVTASHTHGEEVTASHTHCEEMTTPHTYCEEPTASNIGSTCLTTSHTCSTCLTTSHTGCEAPTTSEVLSCKPPVWTANVAAVTSRAEQKSCQCGTDAHAENRSAGSWTQRKAGDSKTLNAERGRGEEVCACPVNTAKHKGEEDVQRGEENLLRVEEDHLRGEENLLRGEEYLLRGEEYILREEENLLRGEEDVRVCLMGLHCCGDLSPVMLRLFHHVPIMRALCCVSCCYHRMQLQPGSDQFHNFPLSAAAKDAYTEVSTKKQSSSSSLSSSPLSPSCLLSSPPLSSSSSLTASAVSRESVGSFLTPCSLRLAAQETRVRWSVQSAEDRDNHTRHVAFRAVLEMFLRDTGRVMDRKTVRKLNYTTFSDFVQSILTSVRVKEDTAQAQEVEQRLRKLYQEYKEYFGLIEPFTCLQMVMQAVLERGVLEDRQRWLQEGGLPSTLLPLFHEHISPRNTVLVSIKPPPSSI